MKINLKALLPLWLLSAFSCNVKEEFNKEKMSEKEFWRIIDYAKEKSNSNDLKAIELIPNILKDYEEVEIVEFEIIFETLIAKADDYKIMAAEKIMTGSVTDDSYIYFRCWLIMQGEKVFEEALINPESLADLYSKDDLSSFDCESLMYVADKAYTIKTGRDAYNDDNGPRNVAYDKGLSYDSPAQPTKGTDWKAEELPKMYPKLWAKFHS